jgi:hypothetical protein
MKLTPIIRQTDRQTDRQDKSVLFGCPPEYAYNLSRRVLPVLLHGRNAPFCMIKRFSDTETEVIT